MSQPRIYAERSSCGTDTYMVCDGARHFKVQLIDDWDESQGYGAYPEGECDGSCKPVDQKTRIVKKIEETRVQTLTLSETGEVLPVRVNISDEAQVLLDQDEIVGMQEGDWYNKRDGEGESFRLADGRLLELNISHDWWSCRDTGFFLTLRVTVETGRQRVCDYDHISQPVLAAVQGLQD